MTTNGLRGPFWPSCMCEALGLFIATYVDRDESSRVSWSCSTKQQKDQRETKDLSMTDEQDVSIDSKDKRVTVEIDRSR